jgi:hypothetical protein
MKYKILTVIGLALLAGAAVQAASSASSTTLAVTVAPQCSLAIVSQGRETVTFVYKVRTSVSVGQGQITLQFAAPGLANYSESSTIDYQVQLDGPGIALSGSMPVASALRSGIVIGRIGPQASSSRAGSGGTVQIAIRPAPDAPLMLEPSLAITCQ